MIDEHVHTYLHNLTKTHDPLLLHMEEEAQKEMVPIINRTSIQLIQTVLMYKPDVQRILEIGTAIGYSTLWLARAAPQAEVDTIERDPAMAARALQFLAQADMEDRVQLYEADAVEILPQLDVSYDVVFIDAAKGQYRSFFEQVLPKVKPNGLIITDNILFRGLVAQTTEDIEQRRIRQLVKKIKQYNEWLSHHPHCQTSFVPIGDGLAFSVKQSAR